MPSGCITRSASACRMLSSFWPSVASSSPMRPFDADARNLARALPNACAAVRDPVTSGIWMRCSSGSGRAALSLARGGSGGRRAGNPRSAAAGRRGGQTVLSTIAEGPSICAAGGRDRQTAKLRRGTPPTPVQDRTSAKPIFEQPRRELTSSDTASRAPDATIQMAGTGSRLPCGSRVYP
jgi:hypothetical protein